MANTQSISISLPGELISQLESAAEGQSTSLDEYLRLTLEREMKSRSLIATFDKLREWGWQQGIRSDEDVERVANGEISLDDLRRQRQ